MRKLIIILFLIPQISESKCGSGGITVWPKSLQISINPIFIIFGYDKSQIILEELSKENKAFIFTENDTIPLEITKIYKSQFEVTQAVTKPIRYLQPDKIYKLGIKNYVPDIIESLEFKRGWYVKNFLDFSKPIFQMLPAIHSNTHIEFGCGPKRHVNFCICTQDESPVAILTRTKEVSTGEISEFILIPDSSIVKIGQGMCSGEFKLIPGWEYESTFTLMDASGNFGYQTNPYKYKGPQRDVSEVVYKENCDCKGQIKPDEDNMYLQKAILEGLFFFLKISLISS